MASSKLLYIRYKLLLLLLGEFLLVDDLGVMGYLKTPVPPA
jgi:hypothetical protein